MITAQDVKKLREMTGAGMMDCKKALQEADGDFDAAIDILRKKGQKVSAKRAEREAKEGCIVTAVSDSAKVAAIVEVNCETDFVARTDDFVTFADDIGRLVLSEQPENMEDLMELAFRDGTVAEQVTELMGKTGEKLGIRRFEIVLVDDDEGAVVSYVHPGSNLGVLVTVSGEGSLEEAGRDVAMQVAAMSPVAARREEVPEDVKEKEMSIAREIAESEGKPEKIIDRIASGKLERYFKDNVLLEQPFVKDSSKTVKQMLKEAGVEMGRFIRYALGT